MREIHTYGSLSVIYMDHWLKSHLKVLKKITWLNSYENAYVCQNEYTYLNISVAILILRFIVWKAGKFKKHMCVVQS